GAVGRSAFGEALYGAGQAPFLVTPSALRRLSQPPCKATTRAKAELLPPCIRTRFESCCQYQAMKLSVSSHSGVASLTGFVANFCGYWRSILSVRPSLRFGRASGQILDLLPTMQTTLHPVLPPASGLPPPGCADQKRSCGEPTPQLTANSLAMII